MVLCGIMVYECGITEHCLWYNGTLFVVLWYFVCGIMVLHVWYYGTLFVVYGTKLYLTFVYEETL